MNVNIITKIRAIALACIAVFFSYLVTEAGGFYRLDGSVISRNDLRQHIYESSTLKNYAIGTKLETPDGRTFVYAKVGTEEGKVLSGYVLVSNVSTAEYNGTSDPGIGSGTAGAYTLTILDADMIADSLKDGLLTIVDGSLTPPQYWSTRITANDDTSSVTAGGDTITVTIEDPLPVTLSAANDTVYITANIYSQVKVSTKEDSAYRRAVGVSNVFESDSTDLANRYIWLQTYGQGYIMLNSQKGGRLVERNIFYTGLGKGEAIDSVGIAVTDTVTGDINWQKIGTYLGAATPGTALPWGAPSFIEISP